MTNTLDYDNHGTLSRLSIDNSCHKSMFNNCTPQDRKLANNLYASGGGIIMPNGPTFCIGSHSKRLDFAARVTPAFKQHPNFHGTNSIAYR